MSAPLVSAVVVTRGRPELAARCVRSLAMNRYRPLEVVVLDNSEPAEQQQLARAIAKLGLPIRHIASSPNGFGALRREAFEAAEGELLMSIDDDCIAADDAIERIVAAFRAHPEAGIVGGNLDNVGFEGADRMKGRGKFGTNLRYLPVEDPNEADLFGSANQTIRREAYEAAGGYDPFLVDGLEEADLALGIAAAGYTTHYAADVKIEHHHSPSRFRNRWQNLERMRLYLWFKHRGGPTPAFLAREVALWCGDLGRELRSIPKRQRAFGHALPFRATAAALFGMLKATLARLQMPSLWWQARR